MEDNSFKIYETPRNHFSVFYPGDGSRPYIEFEWVDGTKKRYDLQISIENLAKLGVLMEIQGSTSEKDGIDGKKREDEDHIGEKI